MLSEFLTLAVALASTLDDFVVVAVAEEVTVLKKVTEGVKEGT